MKIATLLRYMDLGYENSLWNVRHYIAHDFEILARENKNGLFPIMTEYDYEEICEKCDGLIIPGTGINCCPSHYGEAPADPPPVVDEYAFDSKVIDYFVKNNKPIFGICGGLQWLNVYFGGTLKYVENVEAHRNGDEKIHKINIKPGSFVYDVYKSETAITNSHHGQMIGKLAPGLDAVAATDDGVIEAVENKEKRIFATQWHPELCYQTGEGIEKKFFENFLKSCEK